MKGDGGAPAAGSKEAAARGGGGGGGSGGSGAGSALIAASNLFPMQDLARAHSKEARHNKKVRERVVKSANEYNKADFEFPPVPACRLVSGSAFMANTAHLHFGSCQVVTPQPLEPTPPVGHQFEQVKEFPKASLPQPPLRRKAVAKPTRAALAANLGRAHSVPSRVETERRRLKPKEIKARQRSRVKETIKCYRALYRSTRAALKRNMAAYRFSTAMWNREFEMLRNDLYHALWQDHDHEASLKASQATPLASDGPGSEGAAQPAGRTCKHQRALTPDVTLPCTSLALPGSDYCLQHVLHDGQQSLYGQCAYVGSSGTRCQSAVLRRTHPLLCYVHAPPSSLPPTPLPPLHPSPARGTGFSVPNSSASTFGQQLSELLTSARAHHRLWGGARPGGPAQPRPAEGDAAGLAGVPAGKERGGVPQSNGNVHARGGLAVAPLAPAPLPSAAPALAVPGAPPAAATTPPPPRAPQAVAVVPVVAAPFVAAQRAQEVQGQVPSGGDEDDEDEDGDEDEDDEGEDEESDGAMEDVG